MDTKQCTKCRDEKPLDDFYVQDKARGTRRSQCKQCISRYYKKRNTQRCAYNRCYRDTARGQRVYRNIKLKQNFGIDLAAYEALATSQQHLCAICKQPETRKHRGRLCHLAVDHDHKTGQIRQLLCSNCNLLIGNAKEDTTVLQQAIAYLQRHQASPS